MTADGDKALKAISALFPSEGGIRRPDAVPDFFRLRSYRTARIARPAFFDGPYAETLLQLPNRSMRLFHETYGAGVETVTGYPWPKDRPSPLRFYAAVAEGMAHPLFAPIVARGLDRIANGQLGPKVMRKNLVLRTDDGPSRSEAIGFTAMFALPGGLASLKEATAYFLERVAEYADGDPEMHAWVQAVRRYDAVTVLAEAAGADLIVGHFARSETAADTVTRLPSRERTILVPEPVAAGPGAGTGGPSGRTNTMVRLTIPARSTTPEPDEVAAAWRADLAALAGECTAAARTEPSRDVVDAIDSLVASLRGRIEAWADARPASVSTADLVRSLETSAAGFARIRMSHLELETDDRSTALAAVPASVAPDVHGKASDAASLAGQCLVSTDAAAVGWDAVADDRTMPRRERTERMAALMGDIERLSEDGLGFVGKAIDALTAAAPTQAAPTPGSVEADDGTDEPTAEVGTAVPEAVPAAGTPDVLPDPAVGPAEPEPDAATEIPSTRDVPDAAIPVGTGAGSGPTGAVEETIEVLEEASEASEAEPSVARPLDRPADPEQLPIDRRAFELFSRREFGLLHHLAAALPAARPGRGLPVEAGEMRIVATARRLKSGDDVMHAAFRDALESCLDLANRLKSGGEEWSDARRVALLAAVATVAAFHGEDAQTATQIAETIGSDGACAPFFGLLGALDENRKKGYPLTEENVRRIRRATDGSSYVHDTLAALRGSIRGFEQANYRFTLGQRLKGWLVSDGAVGRLKTALSGADGVGEAARFAEANASRDAIRHLLAKAVDGMGRYGEIDGTARERMISIVADIAAKAADYVDAVSRSERTTADGGFRFAKEVADKFKAATARFMREAPRASDDPLLDAAFAHAREILSVFAASLGGPASDVRRRKAVDDLHAPLLWLPEQSWGAAWTPTPFDAGCLVDAILEAPARDVIERPAGSLEAAFEARRDEGSFVAAGILLACAPRFLVEDEAIAAMQASLDAEEGARRGVVAARHARIRMSIDRIRRMAIGGIDAAVRLESALNLVDPANLPAEVSPETMPERGSDDRMADFAAAERRLDEVEREARALLDEAKAEYMRRIEGLAEAGRIDDARRRELVSLLETDDLATVSDWIALSEGGEGRAPTLLGAVVNERLAAFETLLASGTIPAVQTAATALREGKPLRHWSVKDWPHERRNAVADVLNDWVVLGKAVGAHRPELVDLAGSAVGIVSSVIEAARLVEIDGTRTNVRRGMLSLDVQMTVKADPGSLVLPEFGSMTSGNWRVGVVPKGASVADVVGFADEGRHAGTVVLHLGQLTSERRDQIKAECIRTKRRVLVVDDVLLLETLLAPERPAHGALALAQAWTVAAPYRDYANSAVPPEMFKGRRVERSRIVEPHGSYIVYGGRRLGKSALLRNIVSTTPAHARFAFADLREPEATSFWRFVSNKLGGGAVRGAPAVFASPVNDGGAFVAGVRDWLAVDERRRILLLLDEADNFVREQAEGGYGVVVSLLTLMSETQNRFKFVLAGLHNVSRIVRSENSPLAQISNDPVRIGPLAGPDVGDAEFLVRGPLAALGYEFERREDVWRILSFANYYPVLIQVFCNGLLEMLDARTAEAGGVRGPVDARMVEDALASDKIRRGLYESFDKTISHIEQRYELLTYVMAARALEDVHLGPENEGLTVAEVVGQAVAAWPEGFPPGSDPDEIDALLDEMEGFGLLRWTAHDRWALRSRTLLDLMATSDVQVYEKILNFRGRQVEKTFDPRNVRRMLPRAIRSRLEPAISPLTEGQETDILGPVPRGAKAGPVVVFGTAAGGIEHVKAAIETSRTVTELGPDGLEIRNWANRDVLVAVLKSMRKAGSVVVVPETTHWTPGWVSEAALVPSVATGRTRVVFVGGPSQLLGWVSVKGKAAGDGRIVSLRPWSRSFVAAKLDAANEMRSETVDAIMDATGGWSVPIQALFRKSQAGVGLRTALADAQAGKDRTTLDALGVPEHTRGLFADLARWADDDSLDEDIMTEICGEYDLQMPKGSAESYARLSGLVTVAAKPGGGPGTVKVNRLASRLLARLVKQTAA